MLGLSDQMARREREEFEREWPLRAARAERRRTDPEYLRHQAAADKVSLALRDCPEGFVALAWMPPSEPDFYGRWVPGRVELWYRRHCTDSPQCCGGSLGIGDPISRAFLAECVIFDAHWATDAEAAGILGMLGGVADCTGDAVGGGVRHLAASHGLAEYEVIPTYNGSGKHRVLARETGRFREALAIDSQRGQGFSGPQAVRLIRQIRERLA